MTGTEVIERNLATQMLEPRDKTLRHLHVGKESSFRNFNHESRGHFRRGGKLIENGNPVLVIDNALSGNIAADPPAGIGAERFYGFQNDETVEQARQPERLNSGHKLPRRHHLPPTVSRNNTRKSFPIEEVLAIGGANGLESKGETAIIHCLEGRDGILHQGKKGAASRLACEQITTVRRGRRIFIGH